MTSVYTITKPRNVLFLLFFKEIYIRDIAPTLDVLVLLVPVTTTVVTASTVPLEEVPDSSAVISAAPVLPVMVPVATTVASVPPAPSIEFPDASVGASAVSLAHASPLAPQEDSDVPLSRFLVRSTESVTVFPRVDEDVCPRQKK